MKIRKTSKMNGMLKKPGTSNSFDIEFQEVSLTDYCSQRTLREEWLRKSRARNRTSYLKYNKNVIMKDTHREMYRQKESLPFSLLRVL